MTVVTLFLKSSQSSLVSLTSFFASCWILPKEFSFLLGDSEQLGHVWKYIIPEEVIFTKNKFANYYILSYITLQTN
jgi:hypothetical protein